VGINKYQKSLKLIAQTTSIGFLVIACLIIGLGIGYYIDKLLNTKPLFTIIFIFLGMVSAFYNLFKVVLKK
jgi:F0F1-type ATP synthase assembly protein I